MSLAAARRAGARTVGIVPTGLERDRLAAAGLADHVALADARDPVALADAVSGALGGPADVTVVCVDVPGCEHGAVLATADGGTVIFFSMATSFAAAALGAEGLAADVTMLIGNGYLPGHATFALDLLRSEPELMKLLAERAG
jgi:L-erythro-3,5-diaminohexanoate dehydrogenase